MKRLLIIGAGGHGRAVAEAVQMAAAWQIAGFIDDGDPPRPPFGEVPLLGKLSLLEQGRSLADAVIVAIGNNQARERLLARAAKFGFEIVSICHPMSYVAPSAGLGAGCAVMAGAVVGTEAVIGQGVIVNCGGVVDHHCHIGDFGHVGTNAAMAGGSALGRSAWMQAGSALGYGVRVPEGDVLAPGEARQTS